MRAFVYAGPWSAAVTDRQAPFIRDQDEVLFRVRSTGICGTDLGILSGDYHAQPDTILGHEAAGVITAIGDAVKGFKVGDRVVLDPTYFCGRCRMCRTNRRNHCEHKGSTETGVSSDGTFAEYHVTDSSFLRLIPDHVSFDEATFTEPLSCALTGVKRLTLRSDHRLAVIGGGPMGLLYMSLLNLRGCRGWLIEQSAERRSVCARALPAGWEIAGRIEDVIASYGSEQNALDIVVDTTARVAGEILPHMARGGQVLAVGLKKSVSEIDIGMVADRSLALIGSIDTEDNSFDEALELISRGAVPVAMFVTHRYPLDSIGEGLSLLGCDMGEHVKHTPGFAIKVVINP